MHTPSILLFCSFPRVRRARRPCPHNGNQINLVQISYKCTDFCDDEVLFFGIAHGGRTELSPDKAPSALMAVTVAEELGVFGIKPSKAMDMLTGKRVGLGLSIEAYDREVRALDMFFSRALPEFIRALSLIRRRDALTVYLIVYSASGVVHRW